MKRPHLSTICLLAALLGGPGLGAPPAVQSDAGPYPPPRTADSGKSTRIEGKVLSTDTVTLEDQTPGVQMKVDVGGKQMDVRLGPQWFLSRNAVNLTMGEPVTVIGFTIRLQNHPTVIASEVQQGGHRVPLRTPAGKPLWK